MEYYNKVGLRNLPQVFINGYPLSAAELEGDAFEEAVVTKIMQITPEIQMAVYRGTLYDSMNLMDWLMNRDDIMPRLNNRILSQDRDYLSVNDFGIKKTRIKNTYFIIENFLFFKDETSKEFFHNIKYLNNEQDPLMPLTLWIVCDPDTEKGRQLLYDAINFQVISKFQNCF